MYLKRFLSGASLMCLLALPAVAAEPLQPRGEVSVKGGTDRSLLTTEFWAPLAQKSDRVLYGDIRLMGDNDENREGNLGVGYRQIHKDAVLGGHAWIDRRRTQNNSTFHQLTFGAERLGHIVDARANIYVPLNNARNITTPNIGSTAPYLAGSGIFYDTNGLISETPQYGMDGEVGYRIPVFQKNIDAIRVYGGGYHFFRDQTENVTGLRIRTEAQVNRAVSIGARFQYDEPRGSQGFLEATLKFPFSAKKLYQTDYLRSRLDESPERDVDIVTAAKVDTGIMKPVINTTTGTLQRVLYVDNSNSQSGDGTKENPYNTLKNAEANLQANDILYVNHGTGTTAGMDQGLVMNQANISVIGSGSDFVFDNGKFTAQNGANFSGTLLQAAGLAPVITNLQANIDVYSGNGISVLADNAFISGVTLSGSTRNGIFAEAGTAKNWNSFTASHVSLLGNQSHGIYVLANDGSIENVNIANSIVNNNASRGIIIQAANGTARMGTVNVTDNTSKNNRTGIFVIASAQGTMNAINIKNNTASENTSANGHGIYINALGSGSKVNQGEISGNITNANAQSGVYLNTGTSGVISNILINNHTATSNITNGIYLFANGSSTIENIQVSNSVANLNTMNGLLISATTAVIKSVQVTNSTFNTNTQQGVYLASNSSDSIIDTVNLSNLNIRNNVQYGVRISAGATATSTIDKVTISDNAITGNVPGGVYLSKAHASSTYNVDLGGGMYSSAGRNNITGNISNDIQLSYVGGGNLFARNNYWGGGALTRSSLSASTTIDSTAFLVSNPHP